MFLCRRNGGALLVRPLGLAAAFVMFALAFALLLWDQPPGDEPADSATAVPKMRDSAAPQPAHPWPEMAPLGGDGPERDSILQSETGGTSPADAPSEPESHTEAHIRAALSAEKVVHSTDPGVVTSIGEHRIPLESGLQFETSVVFAAENLRREASEELVRVLFFRATVTRPRSEDWPNERRLVQDSFSRIVPWHSTEPVQSSVQMFPKLAGIDEVSRFYRVVWQPAPGLRWGEIDRMADVLVTLERADR